MKRICQEQQNTPLGYILQIGDTTGRVRLDVTITPLLRQGLAGFRVQVAINGFDRGIGTERVGPSKDRLRCYLMGPSVGRQDFTV